MTKPTRPAVPKLGELLETRGQLDREGLFRAMRHQRAHGGRLGTSLLELGLVSEDDLLHVLSDQLKLPFASPEEFRAISEEATKLVPAKIAHARLAVPLRASSSKLDVAMVDPRDLAGLDELAFVSGRRIRPLISTELRIHEGLSRAYGIDIPTRFVKLLDHQNRARFFWGREGEASETGSPAVHPAAAPPTPAAMSVPAAPPAPAPPAPLPPRLTFRRRAHCRRRRRRSPRASSPRRRPSKSAWSSRPTATRSRPPSSISFAAASNAPCC